MTARRGAYLALLAKLDPKEMPRRWHALTIGGKGDRFQQLPGLARIYVQQQQIDREDQRGDA